MRAAFFFLGVLLSFPAAADETAAWKALAQGGHVALVRHANAPGNWDPPGFKIDDCATQRNLDDAGREQARALGETFRKNKVRAPVVRSSPWCRCLETGRLMNIGEVESAWPVASSEKSPERLRELKKMISEWRGPGTLVLVTHALTVQALLGFMPGSAETVVVKPAPKSPHGMRLIDRIAPPPL